MNNEYATIEKLLIATEGEHVQFNEAKNRFDSNEAARICCALANCGGGKLVFGITDKRPRKVVGSNAFDQPERTRKGLMDKLRVMVEFELFEHEGKRVLVFDVASRPVGLPVQVDGITWRYEADSLIPMPKEVRRSIYAENGFDFSGEICRSATLDDLDDAAVKNFRERWILNSGNARLGTLSKEQLLRDCEVLTNGIKLANGETLSVTNRSLSIATTDRKNAVIEFLKNNGQAKARDLVDIVGLSDGRVRALLRDMVSDGTLVKVGDKRYASYKLRQEE